jgi:paraquat-inducible protein A
MIIACADCGTLEELPLLAPRSRAVCPVCLKALERTSGRSITAALGCALGTLILLFPANIAPLMSVNMLGMQRSSRLASGIIELWKEGWVILAALIAGLAIVLPFIRFGLLSVVLGTIQLQRWTSWLGPAFRWAVWLDIWAMPDVFLVGGFVGYSRVAANLNVRVEWGGYCLIAAAFFSMLSRASLDRRTVWRAIETERPVPNGLPMLSCRTCDLVMSVDAEGKRCPRCGARLRIRQLDSISRTTALIIAAFLLYWPANIYPMNISLQLGQQQQYRIIDGIRDLFAAGLAPFGILIFCTSIAIPLLKILGLGWCLISVIRRSNRHLVFKTKLYRAIDELGRWSTVDPFTIAVFVPLMQFDSLVSSSAAAGASAFIVVVVLTLLASESFDPRLMWDAAEDSG